MALWVPIVKAAGWTLRAGLSTKEEKIFCLCWFTGYPGLQCSHYTKWAVSL